MSQGYMTSNRVNVFCDKPTYFAGDVVQGYVLLTIFEPFAASSVNVEVIGYERVHWTETKVEEVIVFDGVDEIINKIPHNARRDFFEIDVPLQQFDLNQLLAPGQYQFPFRMPLPPNLPGSFHFDDQSYESEVDTYESVHAKVEYRIKAFVLLGGRRPGQAPGQGQGQAQQVTARCPNLHDSVEIIVLQRLVRPPAELSAETVKQVRSCCFSSGMVVVRVRAAKDPFVAGETAQMMLEIENHTDLRFEDVWVELDRIVVVRAAGCKYLSDEKLHKQRFAGLPAGVSYLGDRAKTLTFTLPCDLEPTTVASLVTCSYRVWVALSAGPWTSHPRLQVPITVYARPPAPPAPRRGMYGPVAGDGGGGAAAAMTRAMPGSGGAPQTVAPAVIVNLPCNALPGFQGQQQYPQQQQQQPQQQQQVPCQGPQASCWPPPPAGPVPGAIYTAGPAATSVPQPPAGPCAPSIPAPAAGCTAPTPAPSWAPLACPPPPPSAPRAPGGTYAAAGTTPPRPCCAQPQQQPAGLLASVHQQHQQQQQQQPSSLGNEWNVGDDVANPFFARLPA